MHVLTYSLHSYRATIGSLQNVLDELSNDKNKDTAPAAELVRREDGYHMITHRYRLDCNSYYKLKRKQ